MSNPQPLIGTAAAASGAVLQRSATSRLRSFRSPAMHGSRAQKLALCKGPRKARESSAWLAAKAAACTALLGALAAKTSRTCRCSSTTGSAAEVSSEWDKSAEIYAPFEAYTAQFTRTAAGILIESLKANANAGKTTIRVMDAAAGTGASTFALAKCLAKYCESTGQTAEVLATDFSDAMIKQLNTKLETPSSDQGDVQATQAAVKQNLLKVSASVADAQDLSAFADSSLLAMTMTFGIMFPPSPTKVVKEIRRVLAPGGVAVICTWHYNDLAVDLVPELAHALMGKPKFMDLFPDAMKFGQEGFMRRLFRGDLEDCGEGIFKDEDIEAKFVSGTGTVKPAFIAASLNINPVFKQVGTWDEEAVEKYIAPKCGSDGIYHMRGSALMLIVRKR